MNLFLDSFEVILRRSETLLEAENSVNIQGNSSTLCTTILIVHTRTPIYRNFVGNGIIYIYFIKRVQIYGLLYLKIVCRHETVRDAKKGYCTINIVKQHVCKIINNLQSLMRRLALVQISWWTEEENSTGARF